MLDGFTPWPPELAQRFRAAGYWEGLTLWGMVARTVARLPDKVALVAGERRETYADLDRASARLGAALLRQGIRPLDRVVVQLPNTPEFVHWYLALVRIGAIPVLALRAHRHTEVRHFIRASGAVAYVVPDVAHHFDYRPMATQMQAEFAGLRVFVVGEAGDGQTAHAALLDGVAGDDDAAIAATLATARFEPTDVATMLLSGGTTSLSKLIPRTHEDYVLNARLCGRAGGLRRADGVHGHPAAGPQLQPGLAGHPGRLLRRRHRGAGAQHRHGRDLPPGRSGARDRDRGRGAADQRLAGLG